MVKLSKLCDANKPPLYIIYLKPYNLYGLCMMKLLLIEKFNSNNPIGCFLAADLDYPNKSHDLYNDYHLACEKVKVTKEMLSKYQLRIIENNNFSLCK